MAREISKEKKKILGPMIRLERQKLRLTRKQIITDGQGGQICSATTLYRLEKGRVIQESDVYFSLIEKLNSKYVENRSLDKMIERINQKMMSYFETLEKSVAKSLLSEIVTLKGGQNFYYHQILTGYSDMILVNLNQKKLTESEYLYYKRLMEFMPETYNVLLLHLCFCHAYNFIQKMPEIEFYECFLMQFKEYFIIRIDILLLLRSENRFLEYESLHQKISEEIKEKHLINQQCKVQAFYVQAIAEYQKPELRETLLHLERMMAENKCQLNPAIYNNICSMMAMTYYVDLKNYEKAAILFETLLKVDINKMYSIGMYYFSACELSNRQFLPGIFNDIDIQQTNVYLRYYYLKYIKHLSITDLVHYLKTEVLDELLQNGNELRVSVFKKQWKLLLEQSPNKFYKDYYAFMKNFE